MPRQQGMTLIELIIAMVVLSSISVVMFQTATNINQSSVDPIIRSQALNIASAYIEEIETKAFFDPKSGLFCPDKSITNQQHQARREFDDICDYRFLLDNKVRDINGNLVTGLENYSIEITVEQQTQQPLNEQLTAKISIDVLPPNNQMLTLNLYRVANE